MTTEVFVLLIMFKNVQYGLWMSPTKSYPTYAKCEAAAKKAKAHYNHVYDPEKKYTNGDIVDAYCI